MKLQKQFSRLKIDEYLDLEARDDVKHEYVDGVIVAMVGGTARHNQISTAITAFLRDFLKDKPRTVFMSDMKVRAEISFYYPDVMVVCDPIDPKSLYQTKPVILVEVLSDSTESKDRLEKLVAYQKLSSLKEYLLVSQDKVSVDIYSRTDDGWTIDNIGHGEIIDLYSINLSTPIEKFYEDVLGNM